MKHFGISGEKAKLYDRYRLPYAGEAVDTLLNEIGRVEVVADVGAGTGQLTSLLQNRCAQIHMIEPDSAMRAVASTLFAHAINIDIRDASAEDTTLADNSIDLIVIGNAFHRFRPEACDELRRILKKQGWITLFSFHFINREFTDMLFSKLGELNNVRERMKRSWHKTPITALFGNGPLHTLQCPQSVVEDWNAFFGSACSGIEAPEPGEQEFARFEAINRKVFDTFAVNGKIQINYQTQVTIWTARTLKGRHA